MIEFSFLLNSCLDIFEIRRKQTSIDQDLGLLHAIDERLSAYGWLTTTGVKLLIIVDLLGSESSAIKPAGPVVSGLRDSDLKPVCQKMNPLGRVSLNTASGISGVTERIYSASAKPLLFSRRPYPRVWHRGRLCVILSAHL